MTKEQSPTLIIEDDQDMRWALRTILGQVGVPAIEAGEGLGGLELAARVQPALVLLDMRIPGVSGEEVLARLRRLHRDIPVIVITGHGSICGAVDAIRAGAFDYITKPFDVGEVTATIRRALSQQRATPAQPTGSLRQTVTESMGHGPQIDQLIAQMEVAASTDYSVLICGETGTGKEVVAQALHRHGLRAARPMIVLDCGAVVEALVDSEFFGHERGSYTGASERRRGRFELAAEGGTIFLDEIGNLCSVGQRALLRALEERVIYRVGGTTPIRLDTRVIAATNEDILHQEDGGSFRRDLFYRLAEHTISVPPLRTRPEDIEFLVRRFLDQAQRAVVISARDITPEAVALLKTYDWPGNVRQLRNVVRRASLMTVSKINADHVSAALSRPPARGPAHIQVSSPVEAPLRDLVEQRVKQVERDAILKALGVAGGNKAAAARQLGIDYKTFRVKLKTIQQHEWVGQDATAA